MTQVRSTIKFMPLERIHHIPTHHNITYVRIVCDFNPPKDYPNWVQITVGVNLIDYPGEITTHTANVITK